MTKSLPQEVLVLTIAGPRLGNDGGTRLRVRGHLSFSGSFNTCRAVPGIQAPTSRVAGSATFLVPRKPTDGQLAPAVPDNATMRFLSSFLSVSLLVAGAFAAKKSPNERWGDFHAKSLSSSPLKLKETSYKSLTAAPRDYSVAVLLTALEARFGCQLCREFQPEWEIVGKSWTKGDKAGDSRLLFGTLDFADGRDIFMSVRRWD